MNKNIRFSVITVCYNSAPNYTKGFTKYQMMQTYYKNIEYSNYRWRFNR